MLFETAAWARFVPLGLFFNDWSVWIFDADNIEAYCDVQGREVLELDMRILSGAMSDVGCKESPSHTLCNSDLEPNLTQRVSTCV